MTTQTACIFNIQRFSIHDGPGIRTTVFFKGCPLRCGWCANPESQARTPEPIWDNAAQKEVISGQYLTLPEVMTPILKDRAYYEESGGGVTVSGGEVLAQKDFVFSLLDACRKEGIPTACETSAYSNRKDFADLISRVDLIMMDVKHHSEAQHHARTGGSLAVVLANLDQAVASGRSLLVRIPIIPDYNNSEADAHAFGELLRAHHVKAVELLPFHQFGKNKYRFLHRDYAYADYHALTRADVEPLAEIINTYGVKATINGG